MLAAEYGAASSINSSIDIAFDKAAHGRAVVTGIACLTARDLYSQLLVNAGRCVRSLTPKKLTWNKNFRSLRSTSAMCAHRLIKHLESIRVAAEPAANPANS